VAPDAEREIQDHLLELLDELTRILDVVRDRFTLQRSGGGGKERAGGY
jgi:hypothetical protein